MTRINFDIAEYDVDCAQAITLAESMYARIDAIAPTLEDELRESTTEWGYEPPRDLQADLHSIDQEYRNLLIMQNIHRLYKMDKAERDRLCKEGGIPRINGNIYYTVREMDTLQSIARDHGVDWLNIAEYNDIQPSDLYTGMVLTIPIDQEGQSARAVRDNNMVFDTHVGVAVYGKDIDDRFTVVETDGSLYDIAVISGISNMEQALDHIVTTEKGGHPTIPQFGIERLIGGVLSDSRELLSRVLEERYTSAVLSDPRIKAVSVVEVDPGDGGVRINGKLLGINAVRAQEVIEHSSPRREE